MCDDVDAHDHHRRAFAAAALRLAALAAGCGDSDDEAATSAAPKTVDAAQVEQGIAADLSTPSAKVTKAKCPDDVAVEKGATFTCTVTFDTGATRQGDGDPAGRPAQYTYALKAGSVQVPGATAEAAVEKSLAAQGAPNATVNCPDTIIVKTGTTVTCDVSGAQGAATGTVTFTFSDAEGTVDPSSVTT